MFVLGKEEKNRITAKQKTEKMPSLPSQAPCSSGSLVQGRPAVLLSYCHALTEEDAAPFYVGSDA